MSDALRGFSCFNCILINLLEVFAISDSQTGYNHTLNILLDFGELMISSGAEVNRVEDALNRLGKSYGVERMSVFAITSNMIVTMIDSDGNSYTQSRRMVSSASTDYKRLEALNELSRSKCSLAIDEHQFEERIHELKSSKANTIKICIGSMLAAGAFAIFFGGTIGDAVAAVFFAVLIYFMQEKFRQYCPNTMIFNLLSAFFVGIFICVAAKLFSLNADKIMIGDIMLLIPGIAFTNSIRNLLVGDTITGVMRLVETVLWAASLALGFVLSTTLIGV